MKEFLLDFEKKTMRLKVQNIAQNARLCFLSSDVLPEDLYLYFGVTSFIKRLLTKEVPQKSSSQCNLAGFVDLRELPHSAFRTLV